MAELQINLLGGFEVWTAAGSVHAIASKKARGLLAYLAVSPHQRHSRDKLAALLWPDSDSEARRISLRQTLSRLRRQLPPTDFDVVVNHGDDLSFVADAAVVDVEAFEHLLRTSTLESLQEAVRLYRGAFLDGLQVTAPGFEAWLDGERQRLHELALDAHAKLLAHQIDGNADEPAMETATRLLVLDPSEEFAHRCLMRLYAGQGRTVAALRQYKDCVECLQRELEVAPEWETTALYVEIRQRRERRAAVRPVSTPKSARRPPPSSWAAVAGRESKWRSRILIAATTLTMLAVVVVAWRYPVGSENDGRDPGAGRAVEQANVLLRDHYWTDKKQVSEARALLIEALALDPENAEAHAKLGLTYWLEVRHLGWGGGPYELARARGLALKAITLGNSPAAYRLLAKIYLFPVWEAERDHDHAVAAARTAVALEPGNPNALADFAEALLLSGRPDEALAFIARAKRLSPRAPPWYRRIAGQAYLLSGRYERAVAELMPLRRASLRRCCLGDFLPLLAASLALTGRTDEAAEVLRPYRERYPTTTVEGITTFFKAYRRQRDVELILRGVALAGMPATARSL